MDPLAQKLSLKSHSQRLVLRKQPQEKLEHIYMKAFLWALYLPLYPDLQVEVPAQKRFKPDLFSYDAQGDICFWGEAGAVSPQKYQHLLKHQPDTHFTFARWGMTVEQHLALLRPHFPRRRTAAVDVLVFDKQSPERFIHQDQIQIAFADLSWQRL